MTETLPSVAARPVDAPGATAAPTPDEAGFRAWATVRMTALRRKAYLLTGDWHTADDVVQDTLVSLYARWPGLVARGNPDAYASKVLVTRFLDNRRRPWRRESPSEVLPDRLDDAAARSLALVDDRDDELAAALATLPADQRTVVVLRYADDLPLDDVARMLDLPLGTVKSRASRGTRALRTELIRRGHPLAPSDPTDADPTPAAPTPAAPTTHADPTTDREADR